VTLRLNLASGTDLRPAEQGWKNLDIVRRWPSNSRDCDLVWDARSNEIPFKSGTVDEIVAGYLFLHVPYPHHEPLAAEMFRVMKPGGHLEVGEVDMPAAFHRWLLNPLDLSAREIIWGEQGSLHGPEFAQYDKHCAGHSSWSLKRLLEGAGFVGVERFTQHSNEVWYELSMKARKPS
jgi:SAM-dependent methyltransferase